MSRYKVDVRVGIILIVDTQHPDFEENSCISGSDYIVNYWTGTYDGFWKIEEWQVNQATIYCELLEVLCR